MATISLDGTNITRAENTTGWGALKLAGSGGSPTPAAGDTVLEGSGSVTIQVNKQKNVLYYDNGSGIDFTTTANSDAVVYVWVNFLAPGFLATRANGGMGIFLGTTTANYHLYDFHGSDTYSGGWVRLAIKPSFTASTVGGTGLTTSNVRYFGVFADVGTSTARFDNLVCDRIDYGRGLTITGTTTTDDAIGELLSNEATNRYGIVYALNTSETAVALNGRLTFGDDSGTLATTMTDVSKQLFVVEQEYDNGTSVTNSVPTDHYRINFVGNATGATSCTIGKKVGTGDTATGRSGWTVVAKPGSLYDVQLDFDDGNVNTCKVYGSTFRDLTGTINWGTNTAHECMGTTFDACAQVDMVGGPLVRNCNFLQHSGTDAALLWNGNIDIKNSNFISNTDGTNNPAGIEHTTTTGSPFSYDNLQFSANDNDVFNSSGGAITINKTNGSNPATARNSGAGSTTFQGSVSVSVTVKNPAGTAIQNAQTAVYLSSDDSEVMNADTNASGVASTTFSGTTPAAVYIRVRKSSSGDTKYVSASATGTITSSGLDVTITLRQDTIAT